MHYAFAAAVLAVLPLASAAPQSGLFKGTTVKLLVDDILRSGQEPFCVGYLEKYGVTSSVVLPPVTTTVTSPPRTTTATTFVVEPDAVTGTVTHWTTVGSFTATSTVRNVHTRYLLPDGSISQRDLDEAVEPVADAVAPAPTLEKRLAGPPPPVARGVAPSIVSAACSSVLRQIVPPTTTTLTIQPTFSTTVSMPTITATESLTVDFVWTTVTSTRQAGVATTTIYSETTARACPTSAADPFYVSGPSVYLSGKSIGIKPDIISCCTSCYQSTGCMQFMWNAGNSQCYLATFMQTNRNITQWCPNGIDESTISRGVSYAGYNIGAGPCGVVNVQ